MIRLLLLALLATSAVAAPLGTPDRKAMKTLDKLLTKHLERDGFDTRMLDLGFQSYSFDDEIPGQLESIPHDRIETLGIGLEIALSEPDAIAYRASWLATADGQRLLELRGHRPSKWRSKPLPKKLKGLQKSAVALWDAVRAGRCDELTTVEVRHLDGLPMPPPMREDLRREFDALSEGRQRDCEAMLGKPAFDPQITTIVALFVLIDGEELTALGLLEMTPGREGWEAELRALDPPPRR